MTGSVPPSGALLPCRVCGQEKPWVQYFGTTGQATCEACFIDLDKDERDLVRTIRELEQRVKDLTDRAQRAETYRDYWREQAGKAAEGSQR